MARIFILDLVFILIRAFILLTHILLFKILIILLMIRLQILLICLNYPMNLIILNLLLFLSKSRIGFLKHVFILFIVLRLSSIFDVCWVLSSSLRIVIIFTIYFTLIFFFSFQALTTSLSHISYKLFKLTNKN